MRRIQLLQASFRHALGACLLTSTTLAQTSAPVSDIGSGASMTEMDLYALYAEASQLHDEGKFDEAYTRYARVWAQNPGFDVAASMADIELRRQQFVLAATHFRYALEHMPVTQNKRYLDTISRGFREARQHVGEVDLRVRPSVETLTLSNAKTGERLEPPLFFTPGAYTLKVAAPGHQVELLSFTAVAGGTSTLDVHLQPLGSPVGVRNERVLKQRQPQWVFPIGGLVTGGLAAGAVIMATTASQHRDDLEALELGTSECRTRSSSRCQQAARLADDIESEQATALGLGLGAVAAAGATVLVWWVWEVEVPVEVVLAPTNEELKIGWTYAF